MNFSDGGGGGGGGGGGSGVWISNDDLRVGQDLWIADCEGRFSTTQCCPGSSWPRTLSGICGARHLRLPFLLQYV